MKGTCFVFPSCGAEPALGFSAAKHRRRTLAPQAIAASIAALTFGLGGRARPRRHGGGEIGDDESSGGDGVPDRPLDVHPPVLLPPVTGQSPSRFDDQPREAVPLFVPAELAREEGMRLGGRFPQGFDEPVDGRAVGRGLVRGLPGRRRLGEGESLIGECRRQFATRLGERDAGQAQPF